MPRIPDSKSNHYLILESGLPHVKRNRIQHTDKSFYEMNEEANILIINDGLTRFAIMSFQFSFIYSLIYSLFQ